MPLCPVCVHCRCIANTVVNVSFSALLFPNDFCLKFGRYVTQNAFTKFASNFRLLWPKERKYKDLVAITRKHILSLFTNSKVASILRVIYDGQTNHEQKILLTAMTLLKCI